MARLRRTPVSPWRKGPLTSVGCEEEASAVARTTSEAGRGVRFRPGFAPQACGETGGKAPRHQPCLLEMGLQDSAGGGLRLGHTGGTGDGGSLPLRAEHPRAEGGLPRPPWKTHRGAFSSVRCGERSRCVLHLLLFGAGTRRGLVCGGGFAGRGLVCELWRATWTRTTLLDAKNRRALKTIGLDGPWHGNQPARPLGTPLKGRFLLYSPGFLGVVSSKHIWV